MRRATFHLLLLLLTLPAAARAQGGSLDLGISRVGLSIGNSRTWTGIRLNWRDHLVDQVNGLNFTIREADSVPDFDMNGLAIGVAATGAARFRGIALALGGVVAEERVSGVAAAGLGVVSEGDLHGISLAGLGVVAQGSAYGIQVAGLGLVAERDLTGLNLGGLATVAQGDVRGINMGGLAVVAEGGAEGLNVGGLAVVSQGAMTGINLAGLALVGERRLAGIGVAGLATVGGRHADGLFASALAIVAGGHIHGIATTGLAVVAQEGITGAAIAGLAVVSAGGPITGGALTLGRVQAPQLRGIAVSGYRVTADDARGIIGAIGWNDVVDVSGLSFGAFNRARGTQRGLAIGLFNKADVLHGVQIGLLNWAGNNRGITRLLPIINVHFD